MFSIIGRFFKLNIIKKKKQEKCEKPIEILRSEVNVEIEIQWSSEISYLWNPIIIVVLVYRKQNKKKKKTRRQIRAPAHSGNL